MFAFSPKYCVLEKYGFKKGFLCSGILKKYGLIFD